jgi:hypothetical protein
MILASFDCHDSVTVQQCLSHIQTFVPHGVRLGPLGTAATIWPIAPAPDERRL